MSARAHRERSYGWADGLAALTFDQPRPKPPRKSPRAIKPGDRIGGPTVRGTHRIVGRRAEKFLIEDQNGLLFVIGAHRMREGIWRSEGS